MAAMTIEGLAFACEVSYTGLLSVLFAQHWTFALNMFSLTFDLYPVKSSSSFRSQALARHYHPIHLHLLNKYLLSSYCVPGNVLRIVDTKVN